MLEPTGLGKCFRCGAGSQRAVPVWCYEGYAYCETCKVLNGTDCEQQAVRDAFRSEHRPASPQPKNLPLCGGKCGGNDPPKPPEMVAGQRTVAEAFHHHYAAAGLPNDSAARKATPVYSGVLAYFPDAIAEVARLSKVSNDKHNPGEPLRWAKEKSPDHDDCIARHLLDRSKGEVFLTEHGVPIRTRAAVAWRALAALQIEIENETKGTK